MLDLSTISFKVDTSELDRAGKAIGELVTNVGKLDKAARDAAQTEVVFAKAAKLNADANLDNAKAQDVRLKSTITADKADQQATAAIEKKTKATEKATESSAKNVGVLQRQKDILEFQTQGFSRGQSSILSYAKAAGLAAEDIGELGKVLDTQRKLMGGDPFDKSLSGLKSLQNQFTELKESLRQYAKDSDLTAKQARELARNKERLIEKMKLEGASFSEIRQAVRAHNTEYVKLATSYNKMASAEDAVIKSRKEVVNATNYLTQADQKMAAALNTSNAALDKAGTDSLVKYETALRKSGISQDVATAKLAKYKAQLEQVQIQEQKRREQHLTRALAPQATDVVVSLWSGQNPLTVLLQQGGQITDLFMQSGVAAEKFGEVVKSSMKSMLPSILTIVKGVGGLLVDGFVAAGNAVSGFLAKSVGMTGALDKLYMKMSENGPSKWGGMIRGLSSLMTGVFAVGVAAVVTGLTLLGVALAQVTKEQNELAKSLNLTGASLGLSADGAIKFAQSIEGVRTTEAISFIQELSKTGAKASADLTGLTKVAVDLEKYGGVALKDTAKAYDDLQSKPFEGLMKLAEGTGQVSQETVDLAVKLKLAGDEVGLLKLANDQFIAANGRAVDSIKEEINPMSALWITVKEGISFAWEGLKDFARTGVVLDAFIASLRVIATGALAIGAIFRGLGKTIALAFSVYAETASVMNDNTTAEQAVKNIQGVFAAYKDDMSDWKKQIDSAFNDIWDKTEKTTGLTDAARAANSNYATSSVKGLGDLEKAYNSIEKSELRKLTRQQAINKAIEDYTQKNKQASQYQLDIIRQGAGVAWDKAQKEPKKDPSENYYATLMREATASSIKAEDATKSLTASQVKLLEAVNDPRFLKLSKVQQEAYLSTMAANVATEQQTALTEKLADAEDRLLKLLGKSSGIGRQYYTDMANMEKDAALLGKSREEIEELTRAVFMATPAWKAYEKALEEVNSAARKFKEDSIASQAATLKENESLDYRLSLLGKTAEEQKALSIEYNRASKLREVDIKLAKQLREIEEKIAKAKKDGLPESEYQSLIDDQVQARKDAAEQEKVINREVAVQYREDFQREFIDPIRDGLTDSLVTALFEGGKAGSKKLRDLVVAQLRKPVTMVVNAVVNTVLGSVAGALGFGGGSSVGGAGSALSTAGGIGNLLGGLGSFGSTIAGGIGSAVGSIFGVGAGNVALGTSLGLGASSSTAAALAAAQAGGAAGGAGAAGMGSFLSGAGAAMPYIGAAIGLISLISGMDDSGTYHTGGAAQYSASRGLRNSLGFRDNEEGLPSYNPNDNIDNQFGLGFGYVERGDQTISAMETLSKSLVEIFDGIAKTFGKTAGYEVATAFADDTSKDGAWGAFAVRLQGVEILNWEDFRQSRWAPKEFGDGEEGYKQYLAAVAKDTREVLTSIDIPGWAKTILKDIGENPSMEALSGAIQLLAQVETVFKSFGQYMPQFAILSGSAKEALIKASGGVQALTGNMSSFVNAFYTDAEKLEINTKNVTDAMSALGLPMVKTREEFVALVESQMALGESGAANVASLLALSDAMNGILPAFGEVEEVIVGMSDTLRSLKEESNSLEIELLRLQGKNPEADTRQRQTDIAGFSEAEIAAYDYNQSLRQQIELLQRLAQLQQQSTSLEIELLRAKGLNTEADVRQRQLDTSGFSEAEIVAYDYNQSLREQIRVLQQLNELQKQSTSLEIELLRAKGLTVDADARQRAIDTAGMSEAEVAAYDYNQSLREQIRVLQQLNELQKQSTSLEIELLRARGLTAEADVRQRELDTSGFSKAEIVAYDYNQSLREQISVLQQLNELQQQSTSLEIELLRARGLTAEADVRQRELEISGMTAAQVALYDYNRALQGQIDSIRAAASAMDGLSNTRFDLENQLLTAQGNTTEVDRRTRERDLAGLTSGLTAEQAAAVTQAYDYNNVLREQVRVQEEANRAAQQAADAASQAAQQAADAAKSVRDAWQSITDSIMEEVKRIRNIVRGEDSQSLAYYQQQFAVKTAAARSGDQDASKLLPELSKTLLDLAELNATSYFELQLYRSRTAASLEETARILSGAYGTTLPSFDVGTNYVTKDMTARIHQGEAILPKAFNPWAGGSLPSNAGDSERMSNLEDKLVTLANTVTTIAISTNKINRLLERVSRDGDALQVSVVS